MGNKPTVFECTVEEPHFTDIETRSKNVEGRVFKDKWTRLKVGDVLLIHDGVGHKDVIARKVERIVRCDNFGILYDRFGEALLPRIKTRERAEELYRQFFSDELVKTHGVVGVVFCPAVKEDGENVPDYSTFKQAE